MASIMVFIVVSVIVAIIFGTYLDSVVVGITCGLTCFFCSFLICMCIVAGITLPVSEVEEYPLCASHNTLYYFNENDEMKKITERYTVVGDEDIDKPVVRIIHYDGHTFIKANDYVVACPVKDLPSK